MAGDVFTDRGPRTLESCGDIRDPTGAVTARAHGPSEAQEARGLRDPQVAGGRAEAKVPAPDSYPNALSAGPSWPPRPGPG